MTLDEHQITAYREEHKRLKRNYQTAKIIAIVLFIGFLIIGGAGIYMGNQFNQAMYQCREIAEELEECQEIPINYTFINMFEKMEGG